MIYFIILLALAILAFSDYFSSRSVSTFSKYKISVLENTKISTTRMILYIIMVIILIVVAGFRYYVGLDYQSYSYMFYSIMQGQHISIELGFKLINEVIAYLFNSPGLMFLIFAIATLTIKSIVIKKSTKRVFFALFIMFAFYYLVGDMGQIRSTFAQSLDFLALYLYMKDKKLFAFILILFSFLFHSSSIVFLAMFIVGNRRYSTKLMVGILVIVGIIGYLLNLKFIGINAQHMFGFIGQKIYSYTMIDPQKMGLSLTVLFDIVVLIFALCMRWFYEIKDKKFNILLNIYFLSSVSLLLFNNYMIIGTRFSNYFRLPAIILIPFLVDRIESKKIRAFVLFVFIFILSAMVIRFLQGNASVYFPYRMNFNIFN
ncbi:MAG: EpsG family protein [Sarcina sp.]